MYHVVYKWDSNTSLSSNNTAHQSINWETIIKSAAYFSSAYKNKNKTKTKNKKKTTKTNENR